jgi:hypothetical protein
MCRKQVEAHVEWASTHFPEEQLNLQEGRVDQE